MSSDEGKSPLDIINEARRSVASADEEPAGSSSHDARGDAGYSGIARTREEHIKRATGSFAAVAGDGKRPRTNNPRELKALQEKERAEARVRAQASRRDDVASSVASAAATDANSSTVASALADAPASPTLSNPRRSKSAGASSASFAASEKVVRDKRAEEPGSSPADAAPSASDGSSTRPSVSSRPRRRSARTKVKREARTSPLPGNRREDDAADESRTAAAGRAGFAARIVAIVLAVLVVASVGGFSWYRWLYGDDAVDIQGTWYIAGTDTPIVVTEDQIVLNEEVSYDYVLDESAKTIEFTFSYLAGSGHYRFSLDRQALAIMDGQFGWWDTIGEDIAWLPGALLDAAGGVSASPAGAGGVTLLSRQPASAQTVDAPAPSSGELADAATSGSGDAASDGGAFSDGAADGQTAA